MALVIAIASACASSAPSSARSTTGAVLSTSGAATASPSSAAAGVDPGARLHGTYIATIPSGVNASPGVWKLTLAASGVTFRRPDGQSFSPGAVKEITANEIVLAADPGCPVQEGAPTDGRYRWTVDGTSLTLAVISDSCQDRIDTLTSSEWTLSQ